MAELPDTEGFAAASKHVSPETVAQSVSCGPSPEHHLGGDRSLCPRRLRSHHPGPGRTAAGRVHRALRASSGACPARAESRLAGPDREADVSGGPCTFAGHALATAAAPRARTGSARTGLSKMPRRIALPPPMEQSCDDVHRQISRNGLGLKQLFQNQQAQGVTTCRVFFFHLTNGDTFPDDRATACGTLDEAKTVALAIAAELGRNRPADEIAHLTVRVTDETGS